MKYRTGCSASWYPASIGPVSLEVRAAFGFAVALFASAFCLCTWWHLRRSSVRVRPSRVSASARVRVRVRVAGVRMRRIYLILSCPGPTLALAGCYISYKEGTSPRRSVAAVFALFYSLSRQPTLPRPLPSAPATRLPYFTLHHSNLHQPTLRYAHVDSNYLSLAATLQSNPLIHPVPTHSLRRTRGTAPSSSESKPPNVSLINSLPSRRNRGNACL